MSLKAKQHMHRPQKIFNTLLNKKRKKILAKKLAMIVLIQEVWEVWPFTFSYIKIWLNVQSKISPGQPFLSTFFSVTRLDKKYQKCPILT
jgi:hypothetical protein